MIFGGMSKIHLFPYFQTREQYTEAKGVEPPPYNPNLPIKSWEDPEAVGKTEQYQFYTVIALKDNQVRLNGKGEPYFELYPIKTEHASRVNIPPKGWDVATDQSAVNYEEPMPCRKLNEDERLVIVPFSGPKVISTKDVVTNQHGENVEDISNLGGRVQRLEDKVDALLGLAQQILDGNGKNNRRS